MRVWNRDGSMERFTISDANAALRVALAICDERYDAQNVRCDGFPFVTLQTTEPIDRYAEARAVNEVGNWSAKFFAFIKYGKPKKSLLKKHDQALARPKVEMSADRQRMTFDFSGYFNNLMSAAHHRAAAVASKTTATTDMFGKFAYEVAKNKLSKLNEDRTLRFLMRAVLVAGIALSAPECIEKSGVVALNILKENNNQQKWLFERGYQVASNSTAMPKSDREKVEKALAAEAATYDKIIASLSNEDPLVSFVTFEVEKLRPALWDAIPYNGTGTLNDVKVNGKAAREISKGTRRNNKNGVNPWKTTTQIS